MGKTPLAMERSQNQSRIKNNNNNNIINGANNNAQRQLLKNSTRLKTSKNSGANFIRYILQTFNVLFFVSIHLYGNIAASSVVAAGVIASIAFSFYFGIIFSFIIIRYDISKKKQFSVFPLS